MTREPQIPLLSVANLGVTFGTADGDVRAVDDVSLDVRDGEVLAVVGESGSGKTVTALSAMGLLPDTARVTGAARLHGEDLLAAPADRLRALRGSEIAMIFQDPLSALNPVQRVGHQIAEQIRVHDDVDKTQARTRVLDLLKQVGLPEPSTRIDAYPHELSGGMRQRVMIAMALSCRPKLLIADEPTTALDVTVQAQILTLLRDLVDQHRLAMILVTHDLGVVAEIADRVAVMYAGQIVEQAPVQALFDDPCHPYTWGLLGSQARVDGPQKERLAAIAGTPPSLLAPPVGCRFAARCPHGGPECEAPPALAASDAGVPEHLNRCVLDLAAQRELRTDGAGAIGLHPPAARKGR